MAFSKCGHWSVIFVHSILPNISKVLPFNVNLGKKNRKRESGPIKIYENKFVVLEKRQSSRKLKMWKIFYSYMRFLQFCSDSPLNTRNSKLCSYILNLKPRRKSRDLKLIGLPKKTLISVPLGWYMFRLQNNCTHLEMCLPLVSF